MKAIKLASVFAVTAVAAAVSSTSFAAKSADVLTVSGKAGIEYTSHTGKDAKIKGDVADGTDLGKVDLIADNGVVHAKVEFAGTNRGSSADLKIKQLYVKQGKVSFGRFDGTLANAAQMGEAEFDVALIKDKRVTLDNTDNTGVRFQVTPEFTVGIEATGAQDYAAATTATAQKSKIDSKVGPSASYIKNLGSTKIGISAAYVGGATAYNFGTQSTFGITTFSMNYGGGKVVTGGDTNSSITTQEQKIADANLQFAFTDAFSVSYEYTRDMAATDRARAKSAADKDIVIDGTFLKAEYKVGDLTYYFKTYNGDVGKDTVLGTDGTRNIFGVTASF